MATAQVDAPTHPTHPTHPNTPQTLCRYANQCKSLTSAGVQSDLPMDFFMDRYAEAYKAEMEVSG